jgi:hypothetical protein
VRLGRRDGDTGCERDEQYRNEGVWGLGFEFHRTMPSVMVVEKWTGAPFGAPAFYPRDFLLALRGCLQV